VAGANENDLPRHPLRFAAHVESLRSGNPIICAWPGHGFEGQQPRLVDITRDKQVVWQFDGRDWFRGVIGIDLLDEVKTRP